VPAYSFSVSNISYAHWAVENCLHQITVTFLKLAHIVTAWVLYFPYNVMNKDEMRTIVSLL
jgi:hypothetical protein